MKRWRGTALILCLALLSASLGGCGQPAEEAVKERGTLAFAGMEPEPVVEYEVPVSRPGILADRAGYQAGAGKKAAMRGRKLPSSFRLVDSATGETVYTGNIEKITYDETQNLYTGYGDFTAYDMEGEYYLECDVIGRSYSFVIDRNSYREQFDQVFSSVEQGMDDADVASGTEEREALLKQTSTILLSYELSPELYGDTDGNGIPEALDLAARQVGRLRAYREESGEMPESALYPAVLAKFSYLYQKFDVTYAADCLKDAAGVYSRQQQANKKAEVKASSAESSRQSGNGSDTTAENGQQGGKTADSRREGEITSEDARVFWALSELYRASGKMEYRWKIRDYQTFFEEQGKLPEETEYLFGALTYLSTRLKVEKELCDVLMEQLLKEGERMEELSDTLLSPFREECAETEELLDQAAVLIFANHVLVNYRYDRTLEDIGHYLSGVNPQAECRYCSKNSGSRKSAPEVRSGGAPGSFAGTALGTAAGGAPGVLAGTGLGAAAGGAPGVIAGTGLGTVACGAPGVLAGTALGTASGSAPGVIAGKAGAEAVEPERPDGVTEAKYMLLLGQIAKRYGEDGGYSDS